jgi:DNA-binding response OmpR family regulator
VAEPRRAGRVLVVEDEPRIAQFVTRGLAGDGHEVVVAEDGEVGLFLATTERFDLVVLDLGLPGTSGLEVLRGIRGVDAQIPILVLTGYDDPKARRVCEAAGASAFMAKPLVVERLRAAVAAELARLEP